MVAPSSRTLLVLALLAACADPPGPVALAPAPGETAPPPPTQAVPAVTLAPPAGQAADIDSLPRVLTDEDWRRLAASSDEHAIARVEVVKVLLDLATDRLFFCQSVRWPLHYDFALHTFPERPLGDRHAFNTRNYLRDDREMIMGTVAHYLESDVWALELGPADTLAGERIAAFRERVVSALPAGTLLRFHPRSDVHERSVLAVSDLPLVHASDLWRGVAYQALTLGTAYGRLRFAGSAAELEQIAPNEIVVLRDGPDALPLASGVVVSALQGPLSHVAVLSHGRGTPAMARLGAFDDPGLRALEGELVQLLVARASFTIAPARADEAEAAWRSARPAAAPPIALDLEVRELLRLDRIALDDVGAVGAKATQLAEAARALAEPDAVAARTLPGVVIPTSRYVEHLARALPPEARPWRTAMPESGAERERVLRDVRARISETPIDPGLVDEVRRALASLGGARWIFRSSTNAEDLQGFSGAGLYDSVVVDEAEPEAIARAISDVYASVFTRRAFEERDWYRVDPERVAMAVLVQPFATDAVAMGVAVTRNPYSSVRGGSVVDVQVVGGSVTATTADLPEEILVYRRSRPEVVRRSTRAPAPIFRPAELLRLREVLERLHDHFITRWGDPTLACDVELALLEDRQLLILQVRPYR